MAKAISQPQDVNATGTAVPAARPAKVKSQAPVVPPRPVRRSTVLGAPGSISPMLDNGDLRAVVAASVSPALVIVQQSADEQTVRELAVKLGKNCTVRVDRNIPVRAIWRKQSPGRGY